MNKTLSTIVAAATLLVASHGYAATIPFALGSPGVLTGGATGLSGINFTTSATYGLTSDYLSGTTGNANGNATGLGVTYAGDNSGGANRIDGITKGSWEMMTVNFSTAVNLVDFVLGKMDSNDDFEFFINGVQVAATGGAITGSNDNVTFANGWTNVLSFSIRASGTASDGNNSGTTGDDDFSLFAANVTAITPVPLPAGAPLLLAGLAGLAALRRRKRA